MSYEPYLLICKIDLSTYENQLEDTSSWNKKDVETMNILRDAYFKGETVTIKESVYILCRPELTSMNKRVRDKLHSWDVEYHIFS